MPMADFRDRSDIEHASKVIGTGHVNSARPDAHSRKAVIQSFRRQRTGAGGIHLCLRVQPLHIRAYKGNSIKERFMGISSGQYDRCGAAVSARDCQIDHRPDTLARSFTAVQGHTASEKRRSVTLAFSDDTVGFIQGISAGDFSDIILFKTHWAVSLMARHVQTRNIIPLIARYEIEDGRVHLWFTLFFKRFGDLHL